MSISNNEVSQRHKRRWFDGNSEKDSSLNEAIENFNSIVDNLENPTVHTIEYTLPKEIDVINNRLTTNVIISDVTRNNDTLDKKLLHTKLGTNLNSGSYIFWSGEIYIVSNEENNAVESHRTYMISRCSNYINIKYKGKVYYYPIAISNLTLYGDGL